MGNQEKQKKAQFEFEHHHRNAILTAKTVKNRKIAFGMAYEGLALGIRSGRFLNREEDTAQKAQQKFQLLKKFITPKTVALEFGPGDGAIAKVTAPHLQYLTMADVVPPPKNLTLPSNCSWIETDGILPPKSSELFDLVWSSHVLEHLHPSDVPRHLIAVRKSLKPNAHYIIWTPNQLSGPHDISQGFSDIAQGLHLHEYIVGELKKLLEQAKFKKILYYAGGKGWYFRVPALLPLSLEWFLKHLPRKISFFLTKNPLVYGTLGIIMVGKV